MGVHSIADKVIHLATRRLRLEAAFRASEFSAPWLCAATGATLALHWLALARADLALALSLACYAFWFLALFTTFITPLRAIHKYRAADRLFRTNDEFASALELHTVPLARSSLSCFGCN